MLFGIFLIIIVSIWLLGQLGRWWLKRFLKRKFAPHEPQRRRGPEGEVRVEQTLRAEKKVNRNVGDYVEFEEVEESPSGEECASKDGSL